MEEEEEGEEEGEEGEEGKEEEREEEDAAHGGRGGKGVARGNPRHRCRQCLPGRQRRLGGRMCCRPCRPRLTPLGRWAWLRVMLGSCENGSKGTVNLPR